MLQTLRRDRRQTLGVVCAVVLALCVALLAAVQTRQVLPLVADLCTSAGTGHSIVLEAHAGHGMEGGTAPHHHADPGCVLCLGLSTPPALQAWDYRPPAPHASRRSWAGPAPRVQRTLSIWPPLRGPPDLRRF